MGKEGKILLRPIWIPQFEMWAVARKTDVGSGGWALHSKIYYHTKGEAEKALRGYVKDNPDVYAED